MSNGPTRIQLVLQGGGAKIAPLLAAADALVHLHKARDVEITKTAGTSAGAIVATLIACDLDLHDGAQWLAGNVNERLRDLTYNTEFGNLSKVDKLRLAWRIAWSLPLGNIQVLETLLQELFQYLHDRKHSGVAKKPPLETLMPLRLVATDLNLTRKKTFPFDPGADVIHDVIPHVIDSCALPIFFRTNSSLAGGRYIDGGITDNFPVEELINEEQQFGPVFGLAFDNAGTMVAPGSFISYLGRVLSAAIDHSVSRSIRLLDDSRVHLIETDLNTFDFEKAIDWLADIRNYDRTRNDAKTRAQIFLGHLASSAAEYDLSELIELHGMLYQQLYAQTKRKMKRTGHYSIAKCLALEDTPMHSSYTECQEYHVFEPCHEPIQCVSLGSLGASSGRVDVPNIDVVRTDTGATVNFTAIPSTLKGTPAVSIFFTPPLPVPQGNPVEYKLRRTTFALDGLGELSRNEPAYLAQRNGAPKDSIERVDLVISVPKNFPNISIRSFVGKLAGPPDKHTPFKDVNPDVQELTDSELDEYYSKSGDFRRHGWCKSDLQPGEWFLLELTVPNR